MPKTDAPVDIMKCLPDDWNEDDKLDYQMYSADAKRYFPEMNDFVIHIGVIAYINDVKKGKRVPATEEEIKETMSKYDNESRIIYTPYDSNFYEYELPKIIKDKEDSIIIHNNNNILSNDIIE